MNNVEIRQEIRHADIKHWQVAEAMKVSEATFCRWMRTEMPEEKKKKVLAAVEVLKAGE